MNIRLVLVATFVLAAAATPRFALAQDVPDSSDASEDAYERYDDTGDDSYASEDEDYRDDDGDQDTSKPRDERIIFQKGTVSLRRDVILKKPKKGDDRYAVLKVEMRTPETDRLFKEAANEALQYQLAALQFQNMGYNMMSLSAFQKLAQIDKMVPKCTLAVETSANTATLQSGKSYRMRRAPSAGNPNRFNISMGDLSDGSPRLAYFECDPRMSNEESIAALASLGLSSREGGVLSSDGDENADEEKIDASESSDASKESKDEKAETDGDSNEESDDASSSSTKEVKTEARPFRRPIIRFNQNSNTQQPATERSSRVVR